MHATVVAIAWNATGRVAEEIMQYSVEYLAIFQRNDTFCDSIEGFVRLLQADSKIGVSGEHIAFEGSRICVFTHSSGSIEAKSQRYFRLGFTWEGNPEGDPDCLKKFKSVLKAVRTAVKKADGEIETLHDDFAAFYASKAYPLIYEIENLLRRLVATFMLITVGKNWAKETLPEDVHEAARNKDQKRRATNQKQPDVPNATGEETTELKAGLNILHALDFIHLSDLLFLPYSKAPQNELYRIIDVAKSTEDIEKLRGLIPRSNWDRYFATLVSCHGDYLKSRWERLYAIRCNVAHCNLISDGELERLRTLISEVKPPLTEALMKLPQVIVPREESELVAESIARNFNEAIGEFITCWQELESEISYAREARGYEKRGIIYQGRELVEIGVLDLKSEPEYEQVRRIRNEVVHKVGNKLTPEQLDEYCLVIRKLSEEVLTSDYLAYLLQLGPEKLGEEIDRRIADSIGDLTITDELLGVSASTNSSNYGVDDYEVIKTECREDACVVSLTYSASGEHDEDSSYSGDTVNGTAKVILDRRGYLEFSNVTADVDGQQNPAEDDQ